MSYNVTINQNTVAESANKQFTGGIHGNVTLESVVFESPRKDGTGDKVLMFNFKGKNGETFRHLEWPVDESKAQDPTKAYENQGKRIKHILSKFISEDAVVIEGVTSYEEFANKVISLLGNANVSKIVAIKLVYGTANSPKQNLEFTKYLGFIGNDVADLRIGNNEIIVKPSAQPTASEELDLGTSTTDDLPF
jgi:hypothetical protein